MSNGLINQSLSTGMIKKAYAHKPECTIAVAG